MSLVEAIDLAKEFVLNCRDGDRHEMTREDVNRLYELAQQVHRLAFALGVADALPRAAELQPQLESGDLPPVQFESKLNLPGDWDYLPEQVRDISELQHRNGVLTLPYRRQEDDLAEWKPQERVYLECATPRWWQDIAALRDVALDAEVRKQQAIASGLELSAAIVKSKPTSVDPEPIEMPWESGDWERPQKQTSIIVRYMLGRESAKRDDFVQHVWSDTERDDGAVSTAISRANEYLRKHNHGKQLEKCRGEDVIRWV